METHIEFQTGGLRVVAERISDGGYKDDGTGVVSAGGQMVKFDLDPTRSSWSSRSYSFRPGLGAPALPRGYAQYESGIKVGIDTNGIWREETGKGNRAKLHDASGEWVGEWIGGKQPEYFYGDRKDKERTQWLKGGSGDGFLVWDHNKDGLITDNTELMSEYDKSGQVAFANGYEKLAHYFDKDKDNIIQGSELSELSFWVDDGDAVTEAGELQPLSKYGITQIVLPLAKETPNSHANREVEKEVDVFGGKFNEDFYRATYSDVDAAIRGGHSQRAMLISSSMESQKDEMVCGRVLLESLMKRVTCQVIWMLPKWLQMVNIVVEHIISGRLVVRKDDKGLQSPLLQMTHHHQ